MAVAIKLPKMSDTMEEGVIVSWQVKVGDEIKSGDILAEVETDKATMDLDNYEKGTVLHLNAEEGQTIAVDSVIAIVGKKGEDFADLLTAAPAKKEEEETVVAETTASPVVTAPTSTSSSSSTSTTSSSGRILASPLAKKMAADKGLDISQVNGSGEGGRIIKKDIENFTPSVGSTVTGVESFTTVPVSQMRKTIARRLGESKFTAPHFYLTMEIRMDNAIAARKEMNEYSEVKISMNDVIVKAAAIALQTSSKNKRRVDGRPYPHEQPYPRMGVAMAVDEGLLVPVVRFADSKSLSEISTEVKAYSVKAKDKKLQPSDWEGNTFTISNLGMFGIEEFTAIINSPDACIMAVGAAKETVVVDNGEMKVGNVMKVTLSCDHRVVDGVVGSQFLQTFKALMENPVKLLV